MKDLPQTIKETKQSLSQFQSIPTCITSSKANLVPANNSVAIENVYSRYQ